MSGKRKHEETKTSEFGSDVNYLVNINDDADSSDSEYEVEDEDDEELVWEEDSGPEEDDDQSEDVGGEDKKKENVKPDKKEESVKPDKKKERVKPDKKKERVKPDKKKANVKTKLDVIKENDADGEGEGIDLNEAEDSDEEEEESETEEEDSDSGPDEEDDGVDSLAEDTDEEESLEEKEETGGRDSGIDVDPSKDTMSKTKNASDSDITTQTDKNISKDIPNEYEYDSSDEEDLRNTIGNIPINWYDDYPHMGYDLDGKPVLKPERGDALDKFLNKLENPDFSRTVFDKQTGQEVRLSDQDLDLVKRLMGRRVPDAGYNMYPKFEDLYSHEVMEMPISGRPAHKRSFTPSREEATFVARRALLIREGLIKFKKKEKKQEFYNLWHDEGTKIRGIYNHMTAPRRKLPNHGESYNPPPEYLPNHPKLRQERIFSSLRHVPGYKRYIKEQWDRCLNLYLAPRRRTMKIQASSTDLIPLLPKPQDLRPFPTQEALVFAGHKSIIRTISVHPLGKYLASGSDDHTVKIWETSTGRCLRSFDIEGAVKYVSWNPSPRLFLLGVVCEKNVIFINPESYLVDKVVVNQTNQIFKYEPEQGDYLRPERVSTAVKWRTASADEWSKGYRIIVEHFRFVKQIVWHKQGDYFATVIPEGDHRSVLMHQLSRWRSQVPFNKLKGRIQTVAFHPKLPFLYVVTQSHIRVYNLLKQQMTKKVQANCRWISSIAVHPGGEHFLIGGYDRKLNWFEMECTRRPHALRYHRSAIRSVAYHRKYPLFASAADEGRVVVSHGMVYNDWVRDPLLVPLKELKGHRFFDGLYVLDVAWHPFEPFLFTAGADATIRLWH